MSPERAQALRSAVQVWLSRRPANGVEGTAATDIALRRVEVLRPGRPGLVDLLAEVGGRLAHVVVGLRGPQEEPHLLRAGDDAALGLVDDDDGPAACSDALRDAQFAPLVLAAVHGVEPRPGPVALAREDEEATVLDCGDRGDLWVFPWVREGPHPAVELLFALERAGFNHVAAPLARWTWEGRDLGFVQEPLADRSGGWALAMTSLRDHYASGGRPEVAGGDFGPEAHALGTMTARMHLALDRAFERHPEPVAELLDAAEATIAGSDPALLDTRGMADLTKALRTPDVRLPVIRTHGDFHLGRMSRTDHGWVVSDCLPGGVLPGEAGPSRRSPLADVADLMWSLHQASREAALERDPAGRLDLAPLGQAWETRNRRAVLNGYLNTPGILGLTGADRDVVRSLVAVFELARSVRPG